MSDDKAYNKLEEEEKHDQLQKELLQKLDTSKFDIHKLSVEAAVKKLETDLKKGLTQQEAAKRLEKYGPNELEAEEDKTLWERIVEQFEDILVQILLASATISFIIAITGKCNIPSRSGSFLLFSRPLILTRIKNSDPI